MTNDTNSPLRGLAKLRQCKTRRFSSFDPTGGNDDRLHIAPGKTAVIADYDGAGIVTHIWVTVACNSVHALRKIVLRAFWDGADHPSIEAPLGDFFGMGNGLTRNYASLPMQASPQDGKAFNCYLPMPFAKGMKFTVTNEAEDELLFYYYVDFEMHAQLDDDMGRLHAQYRQDIPEAFDETGLTNEEVLFGGETTDGADNYTFMEAEGHGHYIGVIHNVFSRRRSNEWDWYGEGDDMFFIDGEQGFEVPNRPEGVVQVGELAPYIEPRPESAPGANDAWPPTLHGTGTEDYFNTAWCPTQDYSAPYHGIIAGGGPNWTDPVCLYRWHIEDPVVFHKYIRATIERGHANRRSDAMSSVAFWYGDAARPLKTPLPPVTDRIPLFRRPFQDMEQARKKAQS
ncbi:glycoside hydrolase family 172 protein [Oceaniglobus trochenteri]|uniref:glycoside hydrolase family 172 protein n=1 Tax=Oceaniglobus trochenteri TaxID=2763260 RepID=UPI001CFFF341|nr:glycoside hydrolase family 172 protein [Oceaniglobus trochenteri]